MRGFLLELVSSGLLGKRQQGITSQAVLHPFGLGGSAKGFIEINGWLVPVQHAPFEAATATGNGQLRQVTQQLFAGTTATRRRGNVEVFQIQAGLALPGGIIEEIHRIAHRLLVLQADQAMGGAVRAKQRLFDIGHTGHYFVFGLFINGQFADITQNQCSIVMGGGADGNGQR